MWIYHKKDFSITILKFQIYISVFLLPFCAFPFHSTFIEFVPKRKRNVLLFCTDYVNCDYRDYLSISIQNPLSLEYSSRRAWGVGSTLRNSKREQNSTLNVRYESRGQFPFITFLPMKGTLRRTGTVIYQGVKIDSGR